MASQALQSLQTSISEINELRKAHVPTIGIASANPLLTRAIGRASVVLLYSHFERYIYGINEELVDFINSNNITGHNLPENLRLIHSKPAIEQIAEMQWDNREDKLQDFVRTESWLWGNNQTGDLIPDRILEWMKSPSPANIIRYYRYWGIEDIFTSITRTSHTRDNIWHRLQELVDKRHNIAHGDATAEASSNEINLYLRTVLTFCKRADRVLAKKIQRLLITQAPW